MTTNTQMNSLPTVRSAFARDSAYWGERADWLIVYTTHRDADCLNRSNYRTVLRMLGAKGTEGAKGSQSITDNLAIEEASHWACGWVQRIVIRPATKALRDSDADAWLECVRQEEAVAKVLGRIESYPVLDENDFCELETEEANQIWTSCYSVADRIEYIRKHRSQFEFGDFADMLGCVRGKYFAGYASELIG
jgi:hypothetical protein